jgi:hypothetical protein
MLKRTEIAIFILLAFGILRNPKYKLLHVVWSGFNEAFRAFFPGEDPVTWMKNFHKEDLIELHLARGGAMFKPSINLLHSLSEEERVVSARQRLFLERFAVAWQLRRKCEQQPTSNVSVEQRAEDLWIEGKTLEALRLLGYLE